MLSEALGEIVCGGLNIGTANCARADTITTIAMSAERDMASVTEIIDKK